MQVTLWRLPAKQVKRGSPPILLPRPGSTQRQSACAECSFELPAFAVLRVGGARCQGRRLINQTPIRRAKAPALHLAVESRLPHAERSGSGANIAIERYQSVRELAAF